MLDLTKLSDFNLAGLEVRPSRASIYARGYETRIEPKVMEMLVALAKADGHTLSRDEMIERCWGGRIVSDDAITRILSKVRKIGALLNPPAFEVLTLPKIGSRLVMAGAKSDPVVIVLPFDNLGGGPELDFFSDGVADEVLRRLVRGANLKVIGRASSFQYRGARKALAASELRASHVVDGALQRAGDSLRINVHLTDVVAGAAIWAQKFDCNVSEIFAIQDEIADQIAGALDTVFKAPTTTPIAPALYDLFLRTKAFQVEIAENQANLMSLAKITQSAPDFADAWARLATLRAWHMMQLPHQNRPAETLQVRYEIGRCREIDADNPEALYAEYWMLPATGHFEQKGTVIGKLLDASSNSSDANSAAGFFLCTVGRCREALVHAVASYALNPRDWAASIALVYVHWLVGNIEETIESCERHLLEWPDDHLTTAILIVACALLKRFDRMDALIDPVRLTRYPLREHSGIVAVALAMRYPSRQNNEMLLLTLKSRIAKTGNADPIILFWACHLGMTEEIYDLVETTHCGPSGNHRDMLGIVAYSTLTLFKAPFPEVRNEPRFVKLCARLGLVRYWVNTGYWPDCADEVPYDFRAACRAAMHIEIDPFMKPQEQIYAVAS